MRSAAAFQRTPTALKITAMLTSPGKRRPRIFISYRRDDSEASTDLLFERLVSHFGRKQLFVDVDDVPIGEDFATAIEKAVGSCDVLLAVIGRQWLTMTGERGRRLDDPADFVRLEIVTALRRDILVIPVLVHGATMPRPDDLPDDLEPLTRRQAFTISRAHRKEDEARLVRKIEEATAGRAARRPPARPDPSTPPSTLAAPARTNPPASRRVSAALMSTILLGLAASMLWLLLFVRRDHTGGPALDPTPTALPAETAASPSESPPEAAPTTMPATFSTRGASPTPSPAPTEVMPEPEKTPVVEKAILETLTLPPTTPTPTPTSMSIGHTPGPTPLVVDFPSPARSLGNRAAPRQAAEDPWMWKPARPTPTPPPTYEEWRREQELRSPTQPAPTPFRPDARRLRGQKPR